MIYGCGGESRLSKVLKYVLLFLFYYSPDINNKDIRDANKANDESDDEGESMDWWSKYFASLDKLIMVKFIVYCQ